MYTIGSSLAEVIKIANTRISNYNYADRGSGCKVGRDSKTRHVKSDWLLTCFTFVMK